MGAIINKLKIKLRADSVKVGVGDLRITNTYVLCSYLALLSIGRVNFEDIKVATFYGND